MEKGLLFFSFKKDSCLLVFYPSCLTFAAAIETAAQYETGNDLPALRK